MQNEILNKLKVPAIGLIVTGIINFLWGILSVITNIYLFVTKQSHFANPLQNSAEQLGVIIGIAITVLSLAVSPIIIYGAIQMMKGNKYSLAKISAILAIVPVTSCCFLAGIPLGIWALVVLNQPDVEMVFKGESNNRNFEPPLPPQNW